MAAAEADQVLSDEELEEILGRDVDPADNAPAPVEGLGGVASGAYVPAAEQRRRWAHMAQLVTEGHGLGDILVFFAAELLPDGEPGYAMSENAARHLHQAVLDAWAVEDAAMEPHKKRVQVRRILKEIQGARRSKSYTAAASLEKVLMQIQGTAAPVKVEGEVRLVAAVEAVLGELGAEEIRQLIREEAARLGRAAPGPAPRRSLAPGQVVVVESE